MSATGWFTPPPNDVLDRALPDNIFGLYPSG